MRFAASLVGALVGVAGLRYAAFAEIGGWALPGLAYLVFWLPLTSVFSLALLLLLTRRLAIRWPATTGLIGWVTLIQCFTLFGGCDNNSRIPLTIMPLVLLTLSVTIIANEKGARFAETVAFANRHGRWLLLTAVLGVFAGAAGQAIWQARIAETNRQAFAAQQAEDDLKNRELKGLPRAAWLLSKAFALSGFSEAQFLQDKVCELRYWGQFRWDDEQQRLVITQQLFHDDVIRERLLPRAEEVLQHSLLKPGIRDDLQDGVLTCTPPLNCQVSWTMDVNQLEYEPRISEKFSHSTDFISRRLLDEFSKPTTKSK